MNATPSPSAALTRNLFYAAGVLALLLLPSSSCLASQPNTAAEAALLEGRVEDSVRLLRASINTTGSPADHLLLCRNFYAEDLFDQAIAECEIASATPSSDAFLWLGRTYGAKASRVNPLSAFALARKVHASFARAVELDPKNVAALNDLGEYCVKAPAIVGGGLDQARSVADQAASVSPVTQHRLLGLIARKNRDNGTAEREFKEALAAATPAFAARANINLAQFYKETDQDDLSAAAVHAAIAADHAQDASLVDAASILTELDREPALAIQCLRDYRVSPARSDAAPAFKVHLQLARLLLHAGDTAGARTERAAAITLAPNFVPARQASSAARQSQQLR